MSQTARSRGVSLLEALVAIAVMAIGAVAVVGMQAGLRLSGDVAKQRAVASRLAQEKLDEWRGFTSLAATANVDWQDIVTSTEDLTPADSNATYTRAVTVVDVGGAPNDEPRSKTLHVRVSWTDRANQEQSVELNSAMAGIHPELGATIAVPQNFSLLRNPGGRHPAIPPAAVDQGDGTSRFEPPGSGGVTWVFSNTTGLITQVCPSSGPCADLRAMLLTGYVRFATGTTPPTSADSENPGSAPLSSLEVTLDQQVPAYGTQACFESFSSGFITYYCLARVSTASPKWAGTVVMTGITLASSIADASDTRYKVCRYTPVRNNSAVVPTDLKNTDGPYRYVDVDVSLTDQNFLVIRAGTSGVSFDCPPDNSSTTDVNGSTWFHQPQP